MALALVVLACLVVAAVVCTLYPSLMKLALVVALCVVWSRANTPIEGAVLLSLSRDHGLTVADLAALVVIPSGWACLRSMVSKRSESPPVRKT